MTFDPKHEDTCPNREAHRESFKRERERAMHAEKLLWGALQPLTCPYCSSNDVLFFDNPSVSDPCRVILWGCKECGAQFSDFPVKRQEACLV
jgi:DNA-directed RNA polymerase subunit RPC12/RpoP